MRYLIVLFSVLFFNITAIAKPAAFYTQEKPVIMVSANQPEFVIQLKSNPTTGFSWYLREYDANFLYPVKRVFQPATNKNLVGAPGYELWTFRVKPTAFIVPQQTVIKFNYERAWEVGEGTSAVFKVIS